MERFDGFFNESIEQMPRDENVLFLGYSYEDQQIREIEFGRLKDYSFLLDACCPDQYIIITTGNYIYDPQDSGKEYYDNCELPTTERSWAS